MRKGIVNALPLSAVIIVITFVRHEHGYGEGRGNSYFLIYANNDSFKVTS